MEKTLCVVQCLGPHETGAFHAGEHGETKTEGDPDGRAEAMMVRPGGQRMGGGGGH